MGLGGVDLEVAVPTIYPDRSAGDVGLYRSHDQSGHVRP